MKTVLKNTLLSSIAYFLGKYLGFGYLEIIASVYILFTFEFILYILNNYVLALSLSVLSIGDKNIDAVKVTKNIFIFDFIFGLIVNSLILSILFKYLGV